MSSIIVIVAHVVRVVREESFQMAFVQSDNMVEQFASATADPTLGPRRFAKGSGRRFVQQPFS